MTLPLSRRSLLAGIGLGAAGLAAPAYAQTLGGPRFIAYPFALGVASGDPAPDGFVIWTRVAPRPLEPDHGLRAEPVAVAWEVAEDRGFATPVAKGEAIAFPELAHSIHVEVAGLRPDRPYFYRFICGGERSPTGRSRTLPAADAALERLRFGVVGCQHYEHGLYTAFRHLGREDLAFVFHYGDYIYEYDERAAMTDRVTGEPIPVVRRHVGQETYSLDDYRQRYAQERMDVDLQFAHASAPWIASYDDHEVQNNWVGDISEDTSVPPEIFHLRRASAMQAWYEHMPVRRSLWPRDGRVAAYRGFRFGRLMDARVLDTRQYRSDQPCDDRFGTTICPAVSDPRAQVLGPEQERWLVDGLARGGATWSALLQQVMMMDLDRDRNPTEPTINPDSWAGYRVPRDRLLAGLKGRGVQNLVVLTGDEHVNYAGEVRRSGRKDGPVDAIEFVATSASSGGDGQDRRPAFDALQARNPGLKLVNDQRGYTVHEVTPEAFTTRFRVIDTIVRPGGQVSTRATLRVPVGKATIEMG